MHTVWLGLTSPPLRIVTPPFAMTEPQPPFRIERSPSAATKPAAASSRRTSRALTKPTKAFLTFASDSNFLDP